MPAAQTESVWTGAQISVTCGTRGRLKGDNFLEFILWQEKKAAAG
jgi:hypothetical protein